jgi:hypothetical protein
LCPEMSRNYAFPQAMLFSNLEDKIRKYRAAQGSTIYLRSARGT